MKIFIDFSFIFLIITLVPKIIIPISANNIFANLSPEDGDYRNKYPKFCLSIAAQNIHILPYSMGFIENLRYPKDRMHIVLINNVNKKNDDDGGEFIKMLKEWSEKMSKLYLSISIIKNIDIDNNNWMETSLQWGRKKSCEFLLISTDDYFFMPNILKQLSELEFIVAVSPLMNEPFGNHSNVNELLDIFFVERKKVGSQQAYYINLPIFINLRKMDSSYLTFDSENLREYNNEGEEDEKDPIKIFAYSASIMKIPLFIDNTNFYGYFFDSNYYSSNYHKEMIEFFISNTEASSTMLTSFQSDDSAQPTKRSNNNFGGTTTIAKNEL